MRLAGKIFSLFVWALAFATAGSFVRFVTQFQIESRYLVLLALLAALTLEFVIGPLLGMSRSLLRLVLNGLAGSAGVIAMKWRLEGLPPWFG